MTYEIYSDIAIPAAKVKVGAVAKYPLATLEVNQAFFVEVEEGNTLEKTASRMLSATTNFRKKFPLRAYQIAATNHPATGLAVVGVWRLADKEAK